MHQRNLSSQEPEMLDVHKLLRWFTWFLGIALTMMVVVVGLYVVHFSSVLTARGFGNELSTSRAIWGQFGDYVGGVLNPLLSFGTLLVVVSTLRMQAQQLQLSIQELRRSSEVKAMELLISLEKQFDALPLSEYRQKAALFLLKYNDVELELRPDAQLDVGDEGWLIVDYVLDFFQAVGTLARYGQVSPESVYTFFFTSLHYYWIGAQRYIQATRSSQPFVWANAEWLHEKLCDQERELNRGGRLKVSPKEWRGWMQDAATTLVSGGRAIASNSKTSVKSTGYEI